MHVIENRLAAAWPPQAWRDLSVLVAVSGGADSVALLCAMTALKTDGEGSLYAAHFNHQLRGRQSADDEAFVVALCHRRGVPCEVGHAGVGRLAAQGSDGLEAAARSARYEFLQRTAARLGARYVVTAHTADDQAETILHRIVRGTGIGGLAGMPRARPLGPAATLIRPLLGIGHAELLAYLDDLGQPYRSDPSNEDLRYTRNRIRHDLLPRLAEHFNPGVVDALLRLGTLAAEAQTVVDAQVDALAERFVADERLDGGKIDAVKFDAAGLADQPRYVIRELLMAVWRRRGWPMQAMGFAQWNALAEMLTAPTGPRPGAKQTFPGNIRAEAGEDCLWLKQGTRDEG